MNTKERVKYFYEHIASHNLLDKFSEYIAMDCLARIGETVMPLGLDGMKQHNNDVRKTYPDLAVTVVRQYCEGDTVVSEFVAECTHKGEWLGMKPTGKKLIFNGINVDKVVDGKITEHSGVMNTFETLFGAGIIKPA